MSASADGTDLKSLLPDAPSSDWVESGPAPDVLEGHFSAHQYAQFLQATGSKPGTTEFDLNVAGFQDGYGRTWEQKDSQDVLVERVFEFTGSSGSQSWISSLRAGAEHSPEFTSTIQTSSIPNSFGVLLTYTDARQWRVEFWLGRFAFVVHTDSYSGEDLSGLALEQADAMYQSAPPGTSDTGSAPPWIMWAAAIGLSGIALTVFAVILVLALAGRRRRKMVVPPGAYLSPDGAYWWDGFAWRPTRQ